MRKLVIGGAALLARCGLSLCTCLRRMTRAENLPGTVTTTNAAATTRGGSR